MRKILSLLIFALLLISCSATVESHLDSIRTNYMESTADTELEDKNNLELLITADALFHQGDITNADKAYEIFNKRNLKIVDGNILREAKTLTLGTNANDYRPYMMDSLFVSYYQLLAAISDSRWDDARVIINQSYARQQDMSIAYKKLIESNQSKISDESDLLQTLKNDNSQWTAYRDIMNPALMYLSGIYFLTSSDFSDAITYLRRANGMMPENNFIVRDLKLAELKQKPNNTVWIFIEDSFAPKLTEKRVSLPISAGRGATLVTIAISEPQFIESQTKIDTAEILSDVDAMFMTEYTEYRTNDALRAFTSAISRVALQTSLYNSHSDTAPLLGIISTLYSEFTNSAEVRTWATLPKTISVLRVPNNKSGLIELYSNGNVIKKISVGTNGNYLIYVRSAMGKYDIKTMKLK
ncbi:MAG: hypothetical protein J5742_02680 [Alphaproteobacteria bacterium]|nr:hypothetical protein [Alphaproteobacteria bacterium]